MKIEPYGPNAALVTFADTLGDEAFARGRALARALEQNPPPGLVEYVPAFTTLLLEFENAVPDLSFLKDARQATRWDTWGGSGGLPTCLRIKC